MCFALNTKSKRIFLTAFFSLYCAKIINLGTKRRVQGMDTKGNLRNETKENYEYFWITTDWTRKVVILFYSFIQVPNVCYAYVRCKYVRPTHFRLWFGFTGLLHLEILDLTHVLLLLSFKRFYKTHLDVVQHRFKSRVIPHYGFPMSVGVF